MEIAKPYKQSLTTDLLTDEEFIDRDGGFYSEEDGPVTAMVYTLGAPIGLAVIMLLLTRSNEEPDITPSLHSSVISVGPQCLINRLRRQLNDLNHPLARQVALAAEDGELSYDEVRDALELAYPDWQATEWDTQAISLMNTISEISRDDPHRRHYASGLNHRSEINSVTESIQEFLRVY